MGAGRPAGGHRLARAGLLAGGLAVAVSATMVAAVTAQGRAPGLPAVQAQSLTVTTADGAVFGRTTGPVDQWLRIPYAAPPTRQLRWEPPPPVAPWPGPRSAPAYRNPC